MSIPRFAIHRPVTMFMLSAVIVLLGAISLTRLPVDLMPEFAAPTISINVGYNGVGPLEIEQLITRPIEQAVSAVAGVETISSNSSEGRSKVRLNFAWGTDMNEALDEVRTRIDRVRGRMPEDAEQIQIFKADSNAQAIMQLAVEGDFDPVTLREIAQNDLSTRLERVPGRGGGHGQRRPAAPDSRRAVEGKDHRAEPVGRSRGADAAAGEPEHAARRGVAGRRDLSRPQPGRVHQPRRHPQPRRHDARRRADLPARHRRGHRLHRRPPPVHAHRRQARRPDGGQQAVGREHRRRLRRASAPRSSGSTARCPASACW